MKKTMHPWCFRPALLKSILLTMLVFVEATGIAQSFQWAIGCGGDNEDYSKTVTIDKFNNVYISFTSYSPICQINNTQYEVLGHNDIFLVKYDANGNFLWAKQMGGYNYFGPPWYISKAEGIKNVIYDSVSNCIIVAGRFYESINFGNITLSTYDDDLQLFVAKFDLDGNCLWANKAGGNGDEDYDVNISSDENGNIFMCGSLPYDGNFNGIPIGAGGFLAKYNQTGDCLWAKKISENPVPSITAYDMIAIRSFENKIIILGQTIYGSVTVDSTFISGYGSRYVLTFFDDSPKLFAYKQFGGPELRNIASAIAIDGNHNLCFTGSFEGNFAIFEEDTIFSAGVREMFIFKCDEMGNNIWLHQANANHEVDGNYVHCDKEGNVYVTGVFSSNATFCEQAIQSVTNRDLFMAIFASNGECVGTAQAHEAMGMGLTTDDEGFIFATGMYWTEGVFGPHILPCMGFSDVFVTRHEPIIVGTHEMETAAVNHLLIYANPSTGICNISIPEELQHDENLTLLVYDNTGKLILLKVIKMQEEKITLNLLAEAKGVYNAILTNGKQKFQGKVVVD